METVHIDLAGPYKASMGRSLSVIMLVNSASKWVRSYGMNWKLETTAYVQKFIADQNAMGRPHCFRTNNGGDFTSRSHADYCNSGGIRREYRTPGEPQAKTVADSATWRAMKGGHAARSEIRRRFPAVDFVRIPQHQRQRQPYVDGSCYMGYRLPQPLRDQGHPRMAVVARGFRLVTAGPRGGAVLPKRHDAGGPQY